MHKAIGYSVVLREERMRLINSDLSRTVIIIFGKCLASLSALKVVAYARPSTSGFGS
jgi:hypothetical protein